MLYDLNSKHYNVITNLKAAIAKWYICDVCDTLYDNSHKCDKACSLCTSTPPCTKDQSKYCTNAIDGFTVRNIYRIMWRSNERLGCQWRQVCRNCRFRVTGYSKHECFMRCCNNCYKRQPSRHFCYVIPLTPSKLTDRVLCIFFDAEYTQDLEKHDGSFQHIPNLI